MSAKDDLRQSLIVRRQAYVEKQETASFSPPKNALAGLHRALEPVSSLAGYVALRGEPNVFPLLSGLAAEKRIGLPYLGREDAFMVFRSWSAGEPLQRSPFGFRQPFPSAALLIAEAILVPLVAFDRELRRLGHGKGQYDRALAQLPRAIKVGIGWSVQEVDEVPADPWDIPLDAVLTEREWIVKA